MLEKVLFYFRYFIFWIIFFAVNRIAFELWNTNKFFEISFFPDILKTFLYGLHMDASAAGYFCIIPFIVQIATWFIPKIAFFAKKFISAYTYLLVIICALLTVIDLNIYTEWGAKLNTKVFNFVINSPYEAMASSASSPIFKSLLIFTLLCIVGILLFIRTVKNAKKEYISHSRGLWFVKLSLGLFILGLTFLAIRGGWGLAPMNPSKSYFSNHSILNHSALNTYWLLVSNYLDKTEDKNPYQFFSSDENQKIMLDILNRSDTGQIEILNDKRPNLVFIILESFTADVVKELGGESNVTPAFSELIKSGLFFNNFYSSGDRTDKGLIAILSAFPSQATKSIINENNKQEKLNSIMEHLVNKGGYHTSFYYGGDIGFSNMGSYILAHQTHTVFDSKDLLPKQLTSKWGAYDEVTMAKHLEFLSTEKQPFFSTLLTLSNHEPFNLPRPGTFPDNSLANKFRNTSQYTAECLLNYINEAKKQNWYKNTLFVIVADHGQRLPKDTNQIFMHQRYHIPLLLLGGALKNEFKGTFYEKVGGQTDIVPTLLSQMNIDDSDFPYGNNLLLTQHPGLAFFCWDNGFGLVNKNVAVSIDGVSKNIIIVDPENAKTPEVEKAATQAKAIMQSVFQDYIDY